MTGAELRDRADSVLRYRIPVSVLLLGGLMALNVWQKIELFRGATADLLREANEITASAVPKL